MADSPKTVFLTASSSGIGLATAKLFCSVGWNVVATLRTPSSAPPSLLNLAEIAPERILITRLDYQDFDSIGKAVDEAIERFGRIDVAVCGGGYGQQGVFEAISREKVKAQFDVNLFGQSCATHQHTYVDTSVTHHQEPHVLQQVLWTPFARSSLASVLI